MKKLIITALLILLTIKIYSQDNSQKFKGWKKTETEHFTFIYEDAQKEATQGFIQYADDAWNKIAKIYSIPQDKSRVYITGRTNIVNAITYTSPSELVMFTTPLNLTDFTFRENWQKIFFTHELIHLANFTFEDNTKVPQQLFGPFMNILNFVTVDGWAIEGITTVLETELTDGGRGRSPYFELNYKSLVMDNGFLPYENIGLDKEPPYGQAYVFGYLLMRYIADQYGIESLADIERNRGFCQSWASAVKLVTGKTPQDLYRDLRISLAKKYAEERKIPEGIIISPRELNTNYYKPAIVLNDGTLITLRTAANQETAVVKLDPRAKTGRNYIQDQKPEKDLNTIFNETILFTTSSTDEYCLTADENENVYIISSIQRNQRAPGIEVENAIFKWTKDNGISQLTKNVSLCNPSVSRNGNILVASEQNGMNMRLVQIDTTTGELKVLREVPGKDYLFPAVNNDGTKIAILEIEDKRARVALIDVQNPDSLEYVANDGEEIFDPAYLSWTDENKLTYTCNYRGRLEVFEAVQNNEGRWGYIPVVSDPIGATWAYKNDIGVFYATKSSSGRVIKIKPLSEWGVVPQFNGPSPADQIITFGTIKSDYSDFKPYEIPSEVEVPELSKEEKIAQDKLEKEQQKQGIPIPVHGKQIKHRSVENRQKAEDSNSQITEIQQEKIFIPLLQPVFYFPFVREINNKIKDKQEIGIGAAIVAITPRLQLSNGELTFLFDYFPTMQNFEAGLLYSQPIFNSSITLFAFRELDFNDKGFNEANSLLLGLNTPIIQKNIHRNETNLSIITGLSYTLLRTSPTETKINAHYNNNNNLSAQLGFEFFYNDEKPKNSDTSFDFIGLSLEHYNQKTNKIYIGAEAETKLTFNQDIFGFAISAIGRYTPFPADIKPIFSRLMYAGNKLDCSIPGIIIPRINFTANDFILGVFDFNTYLEKKIDFSKSNISFDKTTSLGCELSLSQGILDISTGIALIVLPDFNKKVNLYLTIKYGWLRF